MRALDVPCPACGSGPGHSCAQASRFCQARMTAAAQLAREDNRWQRELDLPLSVREVLYDLGGTVLDVMRSIDGGQARCVQVWRVQKGLMLAYIWGSRLGGGPPRVSWELFTGPATVCIEEILKDVKERTK